MERTNQHNKSAYWSTLAFENMNGMRALHASKILHTLDTTPVTGELKRKNGRYVRDPENFKNVAQHSLLQVAVHRTLGQLDGSTSNEIANQEITVTVHDADKRISKRPQDFSPQDLERYQRLRKKANPNEVFIRAESGWPNHVDILVKGKVLDYQTEKAWYVDNIAGKSINSSTGNLEEDIVSIDKRIDELKARNPDEGKGIPPQTIVQMESTLKEKYDWEKPYDYWEVERMFMKLVEQKIFDRTKGPKELKQPSDIPSFIRSEIEKQYTSEVK